MNEFKLLPYLVYEVFDVGVELGIDKNPHYKLRCAFETEELAKDFINYQATISNKVYEISTADNNNTSAPHSDDEHKALKTEKK